MARILMAIIAIVAIASLAVTGAYAGFVDSEVSQDNSLQTSSLDLLLENPEGIGAQSGQSVLRTWNWQNLDPPKLMEPGDSVTSYVYLKSKSSVPGDHVNITASIVNYEPGPDTDSENAAERAILGEEVSFEPNNGIFDKDTKMIITHMQYHTNTPIVASENDWDTSKLTDTDGDNRISLAEFKQQGLRNLTPVPNSGTIMFSMTVKFADDAGNEYQGDGSIVTLIFLLAQ